MKSIEKLDKVISRARSLNNENLASTVLQWKITLMNLIKDAMFVRNAIKDGRWIIAIDESCRVSDKLRNTLAYTMSYYTPITSEYRPYIANLLAILTEICKRDDLK